jgi:hypothetical protein
VACGIGGPVPPVSPRKQRNAAVDKMALHWREVPPLHHDPCLDRRPPLLFADHPASRTDTPQCDRLDGLSATTYWIVFGNAAVWATWSVLTGEYAAGVPALVNGPAALLILRRLHRSHRSVPRITHLQPCEPELPLLPPPGLPVGACP